MTNATQIATRHTADRIRILVWSDGSLTNGLGFSVRGGKLPASVLWRVVGDLALFDWTELPSVIRTAKKVARRKAQPATAADFRAELVQALP